jgi:hypothetical protein
MPIRSKTRWPTKFAIRFFNRQIIDAGVPMMHESCFIKVPVFVPIRAKPIAGVVMPLVGKPNRDAAFIKSPQFLNETAIEFFPPLVNEEFNNGGSPLEELSAIAYQLSTV